MSKATSVSIKPGVNILSVLKYLNYKPYYALAEFVDNSIDSVLKNHNELKSVDGHDYILQVEVTFDTHNHIIIIKDNAAGIHSDDFPRAFRAAEPPPDNTKLSEFGMGMKSAACWFSNKWQVRTKALHEDRERTIVFDILEITKGDIEELEITTKAKKPNLHYTEITLFGVKEKMPKGRGLGKVKRHLASIYRDFIRKGTLKISVNGEFLEYNTPSILHAPYYATPEGEIKEWKQDIDFDFGDDGNGGKLRAKGFVAIMDPMKTQHSGFALFRRGRVIEGSADKDEGFRPALLSGSVGSHRYKRLFGELHLEGFKVSHTKDGFQWDDNMDAFLELLEEQLKEEDSLPILKQADKYRTRENPKNLSKASKKAVDSTISDIEDGISEDVDTILSKDERLPNEDQELSDTAKTYFRQFPIVVSNLNYMVHVELSYDETIDDFIQVGNHLIPKEESKDKDHNNVGIRLSLTHPFMVQFAGDNHNIIEPILRLSVALGLSEIMVKKTGAPSIEIKNKMNKLLQGVLSKRQ